MVVASTFDLADFAPGLFARRHNIIMILGGPVASTLCSIGWMGMLDHSLSEARRTRHGSGQGRGQAIWLKTRFAQHGRLHVLRCLAVLVIACILPWRFVCISRDISRCRGCKSLASTTCRSGSLHAYTHGYTSSSSSNNSMH